MITDVVPSSSGKYEPQVRLQVEHLNEEETEIDEEDIVPPSPPFLQQPFIAVDRPRRNIVPPNRLIEECDVVYFALSCAEQVEHEAELATYTEPIA